MNINSVIKNGLTFIEITNNKNLRVIFCNLGASIFSIYLNDYCLTRNVKNVEDFKLPSIYYGKTIGRVSNRTKGHKFSIHGTIYNIEPNEGNNVLHGGKYGLSNALFDVKTVSYDDRVEVIFHHVAKHLEDGYPGNLDLEVKYIVYLLEDNLDVLFNANSDMDSVLSLTNHSYFTLGCRSIKGLTLQINADKYLHTDCATLLPISVEEVNKTLDFRKPKKFFYDIQDKALHINRFNGYDHFYYLNKKDINEKALTLSNSKIEMDVYTDFEGIQIYTSGFHPGVELYPRASGLYDSVAIEPSDSFEKYHLLKKDVLYSRTIKYIFKYKD